MEKEFIRWSFFGAITFHARFNPGALAFACGPDLVTYADFHADIERVTHLLAGKKTPSWMRAGIRMSHPYLHWLATIALARLGVVTIAAPVVDNAFVQFVNMDLLVTDREMEGLGIPQLAAGPEWLRRDTKPLTPYPDRAHDPEDTTRLILSSGTTGIRKKILVTNRQLRRRLQDSMTFGSVGPGVRTMSLAGTQSAGGYQMPLATWSAGGCSVAPAPGETPYQALVRHQVGVAFMSPQQLAGVVAGIPGSASPLTALTVNVGGGPVSKALSVETRLRLTPNLIEVYGSTEAGIVTRLAHSRSSDSGGFVVPDVQVQVVDAAGEPVPLGVEGDVRIRCPAMVDGYEDEDSSRGSAFRDGWFHPGDCGVLTADGRLRIVGRTVELMNFGGVKIAPAVVEEALRTVPGVRDIAAFAVEQGERTRPCAALVVGEGFDATALSKEYRKRFPQCPPLTVVPVASIPRNDMGKVNREHLRQSLAAVLSRMQ